MEILLYIGKSNKKFTKGKTYNYMGDFESHGHITIRGNKQLVSLCYKHLDYFKNNFKYITEQEHQSMIRKNKIKKIQNNG